MQSWLRLVLVCCFAVLIIASDPMPEKRPALLSRYGRAVLSRYGKRSPLPRVIEPDNELLLCRSVNGELICAPYSDETTRK